MYKSIMVFLLGALVMTSEAQAAGNEWNDSFSKSKKTLERQVYYDHRITLYCRAAFDEKKNVTLPEGLLPRSTRSGPGRWNGNTWSRRELRAGVRGVARRRRAVRGQQGKGVQRPQVRREGQPGIQAHARLTCTICIGPSAR